MQILTDKEFIKTVIQLARGARQSVDISTFKAEIAHSPGGLCVLPFWETLLERSGLQLKVRLLINWNEKRHSVPKTNLLVIRKLKAAAADVRTLQKNRCCHSKIIIFDKKIAVIGSHNLSTKSCTDNFENSVLIDDKDTVDQIKQVFDSTFQKSKKL